jgi:hypothetical protein
MSSTAAFAWPRSRSRSDIIVMDNADSPIDVSPLAGLRWTTDVVWRTVVY